MKFTPRILEDNVNVSKTHPLVELFWLFGELVVLTGLVFFLLGLTVDWIAGRIPVATEVALGGHALKKFPSKEHVVLQSRLQLLLAALPKESILHQYQFHVFLSDNEEINALALPGGNIVVFSGLLEAVTSENELAMILAHELGHFAHRDHLRGLGRGLGLATIATLLFGGDSSTSNLISNTLLSFQAHYSQEQEAAADRFGLELLTKRYGHAGGATDFFARLTKEAGGRIPYLLASHPHPQDRIDALNELIKSRHYSILPTQPLAKELQPDTL